MSKPYVLLILLFYFFHITGQHNVYLVSRCLGNILTSDRNALNRDDSYDPLFTVLDLFTQNNIIVHQITSLMLSPEIFEPPYTVIWFDLLPHDEQYLQKIPKTNQILFIWEPPCVCPASHNTNLHHYFSHVFTWNDDLLCSQNSPITYKKLFYPHLRPPVITPTPFASRKLLTLINSNLSSSISGEQYSERQRVIRFCEQHYPDDFDLYGRGWDKGNWPSYKGLVERKERVLNHYKFCLCFENYQALGYITEKIFDCFYSRCVPIYLGAPNVSDYIPSNCFIDMNLFKNYKELLSFLQQMDEVTYMHYIQSAETFCRSEAAQSFAIPHFVKTMFSIF